MDERRFEFRIAKLDVLQTLMKYEYDRFNSSKYEHYKGSDAIEHNTKCIRDIRKRMDVFDEDEILDMMSSVQNMGADHHPIFFSILEHNYADFYDKYRVLIDG